MVEFLDELPDRIPSFSPTAIEVQATARRLMDDWGLEDWSFKFDNAKRRYGSCMYSTKTITLSSKLVDLNPISESETTILHEIAHALAYNLTGERGHGLEWQNMCRAVGIEPDRCHNAETPQHNYHVLCSNCGDLVAKRYRKRKKNFLSPCCSASLTWIEV